MDRSLHRIALVTLAALAACAAPSAPAGPGPRAAAPAPYEVPGVVAAEGARAAQADDGDLGPIPVTAADPARGDRNAPVTIVEFADFQCGFCQRAAGTLAALQREYGPDKIRVVWKHFPLSFHREARPAAEAAAALFERGGSAWFWRYHDALFAAAAPLDAQILEEAAARAGAAAGDVDRALRRGSAAAKVDADLALGRSIGVTGTPAFFVNGVLIGGAQPIEKFRAVIDAELSRARSVAARGTPPARLYAELTARGFVPPKKEAAADDAPPAEDRTLYRVPVAGSPARGPAAAPVTVVEFADFQCPFCVRADDTVTALRRKYGDKIRVVFKHQPLPFHKRAEPAAELTLAARAQKGDAGFWAVHDLLMLQRGQLDEDDLKDAARNANLDVGRAMRDVEDRKFAAQIEDDMDLADDVGASGTPTFFVNGRKIVGAQPLDRFSAVIDEQLAVAAAALARGVAPAKLYDTLQQGAVSAQIERVNVPAPTAASPSRGPAGAKVTVQIWSDLECPYCKRVELTLAELMLAFPGQVRVVWHNHPLPFHPHAMLAAEAVMEAHAQKGSEAFWKMHDMILQNQAGGMERASLEQYALAVGLDLVAFRAALDQHVHRPAIEADTHIAEGAGLSGTPAFAINGYKLSGAQPLARFKKVVRRALADAGH